jgi:hypothetical protein
MTIEVGSKVYLKGCAFGEPGRVLRIERGKLAILWADLGPSYIGRHRPDSLELAEPIHEPDPQAQQIPESLARYLNSTQPKGVTHHEHTV